MNKIYYLSLIGLILIDGGLLTAVLYCNFSSGLLLVIVHLGVAGWYKAATAYWQKNISLFVYFVGLLPGLGIVVTTIIQWLLDWRGTNQEAITDYQEYIQIDERLVRKEEIVELTEVDQLSFADQLNFFTEPKQKEAIISFTGDNPELKVKVLQKTLENDNPELVHYAAATLNALDDNFSERIDFLKEKYSRNQNPKYIEELIIVYANYIKSGLIDSEVKNSYLEDYLSILQEAKEQFAMTYSLGIKIADIYNQLEDYYQAEQLLTELIIRYPYNKEAYFLLMANYYYQEQSKKVIELAVKVDKLDFRLTPKEEEKINFWL